MQILANFNFNRVRQNTGTKFEINLFHFNMLNLVLATNNVKIIVA